MHKKNPSPSSKSTRTETSRSENVPTLRSRWNVGFVFFVKNLTKNFKNRPINSKKQTAGVHPSTVYRVLKKNDYRAYPATRRLDLTPEEIEERRQMAAVEVGRDKNYWMEYKINTYSSQ